MANPNLSETPRVVGWPNTAVLAYMRALNVAAGLDASSVPDEPFSHWRWPEVVRRTGLSVTTIQRRMRAGQFPKPISIDHAAAARAAAPAPKTPPRSTVIAPKPAPRLRAVKTKTRK